MQITLEAVRKHGANELEQMQVCNGTYYHAETPRDVISWLETSRERQQRLRLFYGDPATGKSWRDEFMISGRVSRSTGAVKIPILIHSARSYGGPAILDHCVVAIVTRDRRGNPQFVYRHKSLDLGAWQARAVDETGELYAQGFRIEVMCDGDVHARFKGENALWKADKYIAFMTGKRMCK